MLRRYGLQYLQQKRQLQLLTEACFDIDVKLETLPSLKDMVDSGFNYSHIREINFEDFLGRDELSLDNSAIKKTLNNKCVLVTGAGGSIGSEIVRCVSAYSPKKILSFEHNI